MIKSSSHKIDQPQPPNFLDNSLFNDARAKLYWARQHSYAVSNVWENWVQENASTSSPHIGIPITLSLCLGDSIRCLRSTLDYLTSSMARDAGLSDERTAFPFSDNPENIKKD